MRLKVSSAKWRPFCLGLNALNTCTVTFLISNLLPRGWDYYSSLSPWVAGSVVTSFPAKILNCHISRIRHTRIPVLGLNIDLVTSNLLADSILSLPAPVQSRITKFGPEVQTPAVPVAIHWCCWPVGFPWTSCTKLLEEGFQTVMNGRELRQELWWPTPFSHTELFTQVASNTHSASSIFIHALYEPHQPLLDAKLVKGSPDDTSGYTLQCLFHVEKGHVQCLVDGMGHFL